MYFVKSNTYKFIRRLIPLTIVLSMVFAGCHINEPAASLNNENRIIHELHEGLKETIIQDGFSPPVAVRIYAYSFIAFYESLAVTNRNITSFNHRLNGLDFEPIAVDTGRYIAALASIEAFTVVAGNLVYRNFMIDSSRDELLQKLSIEKIPKKHLNYSFEIGRQIADNIIAWAAKDNYRETRNMPYHPLKDNLSAWQPTPPTYGTAVEPYWHLIRPFILDSTNQFQPDPPLAFSTEKESEFYKEAKEIYTTGLNLSDEQVAIAKFWNCLPMTTVTRGHFMQHVKQISPGGHWMGIASEVTRREKMDLEKAAEIYALVAIALNDAFISCWDEKFRSNLVRPETYINRHINIKWRPLLETPMFPEHTSGHSAISTAAASVLTHFLGENFAFIDSVEVPFGLPPRSFNSFFEASDEAAMSRLYGGIHYMHAIKSGVAQGKHVGNLVLKKLGYTPEAD